MGLFKELVSFRVVKVCGKIVSDAGFTLSISLDESFPARSLWFKVTGFGLVMVSSGVVRVLLEAKVG